MLVSMLSPAARVKYAVQGGWKYSDRKYSDNVGNIRTVLEIFERL